LIQKIYKSTKKGGREGEKVRGRKKEKAGGDSAPALQPQ